MAVRTGPAHPQLVLLVRRAGWIVAGFGVILLVLGWYGVSGQATVAQQLPYLASASIPGGALVIGGLVLAAAERVRGRVDVGARVGMGTGSGSGTTGEATVRRIAELHSLLVEPVDGSASGAAAESVDGSASRATVESVDGLAAESARDAAGEPAAAPFPESLPDPVPGGEPKR